MTCCPFMRLMRLLPLRLYRSAAGGWCFWIRSPLQDDQMRHWRGLYIKGRTVRAL